MICCNDKKPGLEDENKHSSNHQESREAGLPVLLKGARNSGHTTLQRVKKVIVPSSS